MTTAWTKQDWKERHELVKRAGIEKPTCDHLIPQLAETLLDFRHFLEPLED